MSEPAEREPHAMSLTPEKKAELNDRIAGILMRHIEPLFARGAEITLVVRIPGNDEADVLVSSEPDLSEVVKAVTRAKRREPIGSQA